MHISRNDLQISSGSNAGGASPAQAVTAPSAVAAAYRKNDTPGDTDDPAATPAAFATFSPAALQAAAKLREQNELTHA